MNKLDISNWKFFYLGDKKYFKIYRAQGRIPSCPSINFFVRSPSMLPVVSSSKENNGITAFYEKEIEEWGKIYPPRIITIANNGSIGESFFQPWEFCSTNDVTNCELVETDLNEHIAFFLCSIIKMERFRYSWGRKWGLEEMRNSKILLPINEKGEPDWLWMENYSKKIYGKVKKDILELLKSRERERERESKN